MRNKVLAIVGPTATGKSALAVYLAKKYDGEVISADSRQVYKGLNIGTGKMTKKEMAGIPHHLLDIVDPKKQFNVSQYTEIANITIKDILSRKKLPIVCGGTGLYVDTLLHGIQLPEVGPDKKLRSQLEKKTTNELFLILKRQDPRRASEIDIKNKVRLIRAIEIVEAIGKVPKIKKRRKYNVLFIGIDVPSQKLKEKIAIRLLTRIKKGMIDEAKKLRKNGLSLKRMEELGLEYRFLAKFLKKKVTKEEMVEKLKTEIWRYAKRQIVWFKRNKDVIWSDGENLKIIDSLVKEFLLTK